MSSPAFTQFQASIEGFRARQHEAQRDIEANRAQKAKLLAEFDEAVLEGDDVAPIQARIAKLEAEHELLNRTAAALANASRSETLRGIGEGVVAENSTGLERLRADFNEVLKGVEACRRDYLRLVAKAGEICRQGRMLSNEINLVRESFRDRRPIVHVPGIGESLNLGQMRGPIFFDNRQIKAAFERGIEQ
jgi:hypothetical protein